MSTVVEFCVCLAVRFSLVLNSLLVRLNRIYIYIYIGVVVHSYTRIYRVYRERWNNNESSRFGNVAGECQTLSGRARGNIEDIHGGAGAAATGRPAH